MVSTPDRRTSFRSAAVVAIAGLLLALAVPALADHGGAAITSPTADQHVWGSVELTAHLDGATGGVQWAVRKNTCTVKTNNVNGNVDGMTDQASWSGGNFSFTLDVSDYEVADFADEVPTYYCFVFNTGGHRLMQHFYVVDPPPADAESCKKGGWVDQGFRNQGQCVRYYETGKDSR